MCDEFNRITSHERTDVVRERMLKLDAERVTKGEIQIEQLLEKYLTVVLDEASSADYESGSAIVKSVKDDDYITIEFKNFKCKASNLQSYTFNGTVKLDYDVD